MALKKKAAKTKTAARKPRRRNVSSGDEPHPVDIFVGNRLRERRAIMGLSQSELAQKAGITFQQIQKYELGKNRISASRLYDFSKILNTPIDYFFEQVERHVVKTDKYEYGFSDQAQDEFEGADSAQKRETTQLLKAYYAIDDDSVRKNFMKMMRQMSGVPGRKVTKRRSSRG
ncbi:MAG: helix-turn-helix domain-containing protein [Alphaproteobacteria bacterium]|nr:helix-turn-helix domain-containing protein [Alphaproteobacteria bacterium]